MEIKTKTVNTEKWDHDYKSVSHCEFSDEVTLLVLFLISGQALYIMLSNQKLNPRFVICLIVRVDNFNLIEAY